MTVMLKKQKDLVCLSHKLPFGAVLIQSENIACSLYCSADIMIPSFLNMNFYLRSERVHL